MTHREITKMARAAGVYKPHKPRITPEVLQVLIALCLITVTIAAVLAMGYYLTRPPEFCMEVWHP